MHGFQYPVPVVEDLGRRVRLLLVYATLKSVKYGNS